MLFSSVRAGDIIMNMCSWILLVRGEGRAPEIVITKSARFDELENIYFVGYAALPTGQWVVSAI